MFCGHFQTVAEDVLVLAVLVCPAHYRFFYENALFSFTFHIDIDIDTNYCDIVTQSVNNFCCIRLSKFHNFVISNSNFHY